MRKARCAKILLELRARILGPVAEQYAREKARRLSPDLGDGVKRGVAKRSDEPSRPRCKAVVFRRGSREHSAVAVAVIPPAAVIITRSQQATRDEHRVTRRQGLRLLGPLDPHARLVPPDMSCRYGHRTVLLLRRIGDEINDEPLGCRAFKLPHIARPGTPVEGPAEKRRADSGSTHWQHARHVPARTSALPSGKQDSNGARRKQRKQNRRNKAEIYYPLLDVGTPRQLFSSYYATAGGKRQNAQRAQGRSLWRARLLPVHTHTRSFRLLKRVSPIPGTLRRSSTDLKEPFACR